jgi:hypothetical protein
MLTVPRIRPSVQPARRRLAALESLAPPAPIVAPFAVGIARPSRPERLRAPRGGITIAGRFYRAGAFLPATPAPAPAPAPVASIQPFNATESHFLAWFFGPADAGRIVANRAARVAELAKATNPRDSWPAWTDEHTWELGPDAEPDDTTDHAEASGPSPRDEAFKLGYDLGLDREDADAPAHFSAEQRGEFEAGWAAGKAEWDRRLEEMCGASEYGDWTGLVTDRDLYVPGAVS